MPIPLTWEQVAAFRLARHRLAARAPASALTKVVDDMTGAQAQLLPAAQISLWTRIQDLQASEIDQALIDRRLVKASAMRRTLFLLPSRRLAIYMRGTAGRAEKGIGWTRGKGVPDQAIDAAIAAVLAALDEPRTRAEIAKQVSATLGVPVHSVHGGGWGSTRKVAAIPLGEIAFPIGELLHLAAARGVYCYGPPRGVEPTFVRADAWIPLWQDVPQEEAEVQLLRRYLRAFAPATVADFALWTGMALQRARAVWARLEVDLAAVEVEGWKAQALADDVMDFEAAGRLESPHVRLLPFFDSYLLGHKDRSHLVDAGQRGKVFRPQGWIAPVVLVDGRVAGVWKHERQRERLNLEVEPFGPLAPAVEACIQEEARDLARFLGASGVEVRY